MKPLYLSLICLLVLSSCKSEKKETAIEEEVIELSVAEKIANAHGYEHWKRVSELDFTFNVDQNNNHSERTWRWYPKSYKVWSLMENDTVSFFLDTVDSTSISLDKKFTNDKFWLLVPFQLVWDTSATISEPKKVESPINKEQLDMITITYPDEGGYTPGDAYDIYFDKDYLIREWTYRQGNSPEPSLSNTFENYKDFNGIKIAIDHKKEGGNWNLNFSNVEISMK